MATQFQVSMDNLSHWEIVDRLDFDLDFDDDDVSVCGVESLDSFSFTYSSSSDVDELDGDHRDALIRSRPLEDRDDVDFAGEESPSCVDVIDLNDHVVVDDDVMREESQSRDDVSDPNDYYDDDVTREESPSSDDVINLRYHVATLSDVNTQVVDDDDDVMREESQSSDDVINSSYNVDNLSDVNNHVDDNHEKKDLSIDDDVMALQSLSSDAVNGSSHQYVYNPYKYLNYDYDDDNVDYAEDEDDYDVDDELVPWGVKDRFERQRLRKLGKRSCVRMMKAKRSTLLYTKPGCVRGKHGLGIKVY